MSYKRLSAFLILLAVLPLVAGAVEPEVSSNIEKSLKEIFPEMNITSIKPTQVKGLYQVMEGAEVYYITGDGRYFLHGDMYDLKERHNLTELQRTDARNVLLKDVSSDEYIEFTPAHPKHVIYVFTDVDCPYCRRLHSHIKEINNLGIAVRYLAFPRQGVDTETYAEMESVWCAKDRNRALTDAKLGKKPVKLDCTNTVAQQFALGQSMGVHGTPAVFTSSGKYLGGYMAPDELEQAIEQAN